MRCTSACPSTNADAPAARQNLSLVLARRADRQRHAGLADRVEPLARRGRPALGGEVHAAPGHVGAAGIRHPAPRRPRRAGALRRLVRDGSRRRELHLRRRRQGRARTHSRCAGAAAGEFDGGVAAGLAARGPGGTDHRRTRHRRARRVAHRGGRLPEPLGPEPIAVRVPVAGHLRRAPEPRVDRPGRGGPAGRRRAVFRAGAPHRAADRSAARWRRATSPTSSCRRGWTAA